MSKSELPLNAIRVFVTIVQNRSLTLAARALGISQSAVSRHLSTLEHYAGQKLIERSPFKLTPGGLQFFELVEEPVGTIEMAARQLPQDHSAPSSLLLRTSMASFSMAVLVPLLAEYTRQTRVEVSLLTSMSQPEPDDEFDILISRDLQLNSTDHWQLCGEELVCVGAPELVNAYAMQTQVHSWPMIKTRSRPDVIPFWSQAREVAAAAIQTKATYDHLYLSVAAAVAGIGFLITPEILVREQIRLGSLVAVHTPLRYTAQYSAFINRSSQKVQLAVDFCRWLKLQLHT
ncbi:LysR family transcriptional regulator [Oceanimonas baumannii]|uniref:DNA-binding transcriptional LysR family regulator n=1 Tax=Oceanimonas baumannii TaxID=129578 RepID=A0A235CHZ7_9GAMM|nr:LysR family transcriptional regulator [Oceanimonas baumannii]OYD24004.1 hypothetical protein B6S09_11185 [Oceanimonas baumannii]TDW58655.1 DNA-binding transcriptional LysR family regulator [Oceanimonas baumannii]